MKLISFLYPKECVGCKSKGRYFCKKCLAKVKMDNTWFCPGCNKDSAGGVTHVGCWNNYSLDGVVSLFLYKGLIGAGIRSVKYRFLKKIEDEFLLIVLAGMKKKLKNNQAGKLIDFLKLKPVVAPVPLYWRKHNFRGFNQADMVGEMVAKAFNLELDPSILVKVKKTKPQANLSKSQRRENLKLAFSVVKEDMIENVLLVDDVWTTGETMRQASKALRKFGVRRVWGLVLAR